MADNVAITPGSGADVAADDIGGVFHQRIKLGLGADGTAVDAVAGAGAVGTGVQRVTLASDDPAVASLASILSALADPATETTLASILSALADPATETTLASIDAALAGTVAVSAASLPLPTGAATQTTLASILSGLGAVVLAAGEAHVGEVGGRIARPTSNFTRPSDTTAYAVGDLVANSTTSGSVTPLSWTAARVAAGSGMIRRCRLRKTGTGITNAIFRLHLYSASPTVTNGDNGAWLSNQVASYLGSFDITCDRVFSDGSGGNGAPTTGSEINFALGSGQTIYGLLEARGAFTPASASVWTVELEILQN